MPRAALIVLVVLTALFVSWKVRAESALVVLVRPPAQSALVTEAITRIRGELVADGFRVVVVEAASSADPASVLASADQQAGAAATLGLFLQADAMAADVWVVDRLTNKTVVRRVEIAPSQAASASEVLARRSVELLRASLLEILVTAGKKPLDKPSDQAQASRWAAQALDQQASRWGVEAGAQALASFGGVGMAVMPVGRVRLVLGQKFLARLTVSGFGTRPSVEGPGGKATVSQEFGLLELIFEPNAQSWLSPSISLGAGAYHIGVDGNASAPYAGLSDDRFVFAADAGAGLALALTSSLALALEGHASLVAPYPVIRILDVEAAKVRNPLVSGVLTVVVRL